MASDEQRTGPEAEPPAEGGAEPEGLPAPARAPRVQYAADQLQGLGEALRGLGRAILATTGPLKTKPDPLPPHEIGERDLAFLDYKRLAGTRRLFGLTVFGSALLNIVVVAAAAGPDTITRIGRS